MARSLSGNGRRRGRRQETSPPIGDNSGAVDREALGRYVDRVSKLLDERAELNEAVKEVYTEAREAGIVTRYLREIVREYRMDSDARQARYDLLDQYRAALGMLAGTPLGDAALHQAEATV